MRAEGRKRPQAEVLGVYLAPTAAQSVRVGSLIRNQAAVTFLVDDSYIERGPERPNPEPCLSCDVGRGGHDTAIA